MIGNIGVHPALGRAIVCAAILLLSLCGVSRASAQRCPQASTAGVDRPSTARPLTGDLIYHDGIRQWFELKLASPECGKSSVQITGDEHIYKRLESLRGCRVETSGSIDFSPTGYYSLDLYQFANRLRPIAACRNKPPLPDYSSYRPGRRVHSYTVFMHVDYRPGDHPVTFQVKSGHTELRPWQAYASYMLTGGFVLYGQCGHGFVVDKVFGTPAARPTHFDDPHSPDDMAVYDPETAARSGTADLHLGYTCRRAR